MISIVASAAITIVLIWAIVLQKSQAHCSALLRAILANNDSF